MSGPFCVVLVLRDVPTGVFRIHVIRIAMLVGEELRGNLMGAGQLGKHAPYAPKSGDRIE
jgi:hypothetical protein